MSYWDTGSSSVGTSQSSWIDPIGPIDPMGPGHWMNQYEENQPHVNISGGPQYNRNGVMSGYNLGINGINVDLRNAGMMNPEDLNPYASQYLKNTGNLYNMFSQSAAGGAFNPTFYNGLQKTQESGLTSSLGNLYASRGLSGSSAEMGGLSAAIQSNQMNWLNRQQSDQMRAMQGLSGLNQIGYNQTLGLQNQYNDYQQMIAEAQLGVLGMQQQQEAANQAAESQMIGSFLGAAGSAAGMMA